jgi:glycosyltransferase involved in cell wall biosynthesis
MKALHILYSGLGGHGNVFVSMVEADSDHQYQYEALFFGIEDIRPEYIKMAEEKGIPWHFVKKKPGLDLASYRKIVKIIKQSAPEILFIHGSAYFFPAWYAALVAPHKIKIVLRETVPSHLKTMIDWVGLAFALVFAKKTVFLNVEYRDIIKKQMRLLFSDKRTTVIGNGIDLNLFKPDHKRTADCIRLGMQGRLSVTKDHATLIKAFHIIVKQGEGKQNFELILAGGGTEREALEKLAAELMIQDKVKFLGMLKEAALPAFINSLDIYIHATLGEMMSTAIMQVMACDMPIVASDVFGVNNMIKNGENGLLVPVGDEHKLATAIRFYLDNPEVRDAHGKNGFAFAENNYSSKLMFKRYQAVFEEK